jgi:hypothetical protein
MTELPQRLFTYNLREASAVQCKIDPYLAF